MSSTTFAPVTVVPRWAAPASLVVCVLGLLDAAYLTFEHYTASATLACSESATINCLKVTTSSYSKVLGIPVSDLGLLFFVVMTVLSLPVLWRRTSLLLVRVVAAAVGVLSVFYLVWAELFRLDAICLWCTGVHVLTLALFGIVVVATAMVGPDPAA
jgi:uncharacterized membrane protein